MSISANQILELQDSYDLFKTAMGESFAPFATPAVVDHNLKVLCMWGVENLPGGIAAFEQIGAFELSFRACVNSGTLQRDPNFLSRADRKALFAKFNNALPAVLSKAIYLGEPYSLSEDQQSELNQIGGAVAFKKFMDEA